MATPTPPLDVNITSPLTKLVNKNEYHTINKKDIFVFETSILKEAHIVFKLSLQIGLSIIFEVCIGTISAIFLGHLSNASQILSGTGMAYSFANMSAIGVSWGFASGLWTLIPQAVGSNHTQLIAVYVQRAFIVCMLVELPLSVLLFYGGNVLCFIGSPADLCSNVPMEIISNYCMALLPFPYFMVTLAILQRVGQSLSYNFELFAIVATSFFVSIPLNYMFVILFDFGYIGCAIVLDLMLLFSTIMTALLLSYKGYSFIFKPLPFDVVCSKLGLLDYWRLSWPGAVQISAGWIVRELVTILSGLVYNPSIAVAATVVMVQLNLIRLLPVGIANGSGIRIGKYIGGGSICLAKRCIKIQMFYLICVFIIASVIWTTLRKQLPQIFTSNIDIIEVVGNLLYIALLNVITASIYINMASIYRALGYQKLTAYIVSVTQYMIALPLELWMLFGSTFRFCDNTETGLYVIWSGSTFGYFLADIVIVTMLIYYVDWEKALTASQLRLKHTRKDYGAINEINSID